MIGPSLADLVLEIFCFAASPSFRGVATLVSKARQAVKDAGSSSPDLAKDRSDLGKHITDVLTIRIKAARQQCLDLGVDVSLLTQPKQQSLHSFQLMLNKTSSYYLLYAIQPTLRII